MPNVHIDPNMQIPVTLPAASWLFVLTVLRRAPLAYDESSPVITPLAQQLEAATTPPGEPELTPALTG